MAGFDGIDPELLQSINSGISQARTKKNGARYFTYDKDARGVVEIDRPNTTVGHSMYPYKSTCMAVDPEEVPAVAEMLRKKGVLCEFDDEGRPIITSTKQQDAVAKAMGMKSGRDGYGHTDADGKFQTSGRARNDEVQAGRSKVRSAIKELNAMPEDAEASAVDGVLEKHGLPSVQ